MPPAEATVCLYHSFMDNIEILATGGWGPLCRCSATSARYGPLRWREVKLPHGVGDAETVGTSCDDRVGDICEKRADLSCDAAVLGRLARRRCSRRDRGRGRGSALWIADSRNDTVLHGRRAFPKSHEQWQHRYLPGRVLVISGQTSSSHARLNKQ